MSAGPSLTEFSRLEGHKDRVWHVSWHPTLDMIASCSGDRTVKLWAPSRGSASIAACHDLPAPLPAAPWRCVATLEEGTRTVRCCEWSPCGNFLAACSFDGTTTVWKRASEGGKLAFDVVATLEGHENEVKCVSWHPSGSLLATCSRDKTVWLWEAPPDSGDDGEVEFECAAVLTGHSQDVKFVKFHPTEDMLVSCSYDDTLKVWRRGGEDSWYCAQTLTGHTATVWACAFIGDGSGLVTCSDDCTVAVWALDTPKPPSASLLSLATSLWTAPAPASAPVWKRVSVLTGYHDRTVYSVDVSAGAIATGAADDCVRVFLPTDEGSWELGVRIPSAHEGDVNCVRWCGRAHTLLASAGDDGVIKLWKYSP